MKRTMHAVVGIMAAFVAMQVRANYYVAQNGQVPGEPYHEWSNAASNIQDVLTYVGAVEVTIHVGAGHYGPPPNAVDWNGPNVVYHSRPLTLLSSNNVPESVIIDGHGTHRGIGLRRGGFISGITVTNGFSAVHGGGIRMEEDNFNLVVSNCVVVGNVSDGRGGGIFAFRGPVELVNSRIKHNYAKDSGGGFGTDYSRTLLVHNNCVIAHNETGESGGGIYHQSSHNVTIEDSIIEYNVAAKNGGGVCKLYGNTLDIRFQIRNSILRGNVAKTHGVSNGGNAIYAQRVFTELINCLIVENHSGAPSDYANAIFYFLGSGQHQWLNLRIYNCTVAYHESGVVNNNNRVIRFRGTPLPYDPPPGTGANLTSSFHVCNSILYHNKQGMQVVTDHTDVYFSHCCTEIDLDAYPGGNHVLEPPKFASAAQGDYRLSSGSPCIDAGNNDYVQTTVDLDGRPRIDPTSGRVDIGAYEYRRPGTLLLVR